MGIRFLRNIPNHFPCGGMMQKVLATGVLGLMLVGCAAESGWKVAYEQERATRQEQDARIRNLEVRQQQTQQQTPTGQQPPAQQAPAR